jgi:hypothetical protein
LKPAPTEDALCGRRIEARDPSLFGAVPSQTTERDRRSLLALQAAARRRGDYVYLEIGSYLGGTLQSHCLDPRCRRIYSIDKRPEALSDIRGVTMHYAADNAQRMLTGLRAALGERVDKIVTFESDAREVPPARITPAPQLCFIDGEHTRAAVRSDFAFCRAVAASDAMIAFHDAQLLHAAIAECGRTLEREGVPHLALKLPGAVFVYLFGAAIERHGSELRAIAQAAWWYRCSSPLILAGERCRLQTAQLLWTHVRRGRNWLRARVQGGR